MTNVELFNIFQKYNEEQLNIFDIKCNLKEMETEYKTTPYALAFPEKSVYEAYDEFYHHETNLGGLVYNFLKYDVPVFIETVSSRLDLNKTFNELDPENKELLKTIVQQYL